MGQMLEILFHGHAKVIILLTTFLVMFSFVLSLFSPEYLLNFNKMDDKSILNSYNIGKLNTAFSERISSAIFGLIHNSKGHLNVTTLNSVLIDATKPDYFSKLENLAHIQSIMFNLPRQNLNEYLPKQLYTIHSNDCKKLVETGLSSFHHKIRNCSETAVYSSQQTAFFTSKYEIAQLTGNFKAKPLSTKHEELQTSASIVTVDFLHIVKDAIILPEGDFHVGKHRISIQRCQRQLVSKVGPEDITTLPEVYSIAQYWGEGFFHFTIEDLPRIMIGLEYLMKNKHVYVHVHIKNGFVKDLLKDIGIDHTRLVSGVVKADILLVPRGTACGSGAVFNTNSLSLHMRSLSGQTKPKQDTIILIKRSTRRWFDNHGQILNMIQNISRKANLNTQVFGDRPVMGLQKTKELFHRAVMVVAPHGAGLSNILFSQTGTCVVEGLCNIDNRVNLCYKYLAFILGHRYHGVVKTYHCRKMQPDDLRVEIEHCLDAVL